MSSMILNVCVSIGAILLLVNLTGILMIGFVQARLRGLDRQGRDLLDRSGQAELKLQALEDANTGMVEHIDRLAADVIHRELYRDKGSRQKLAIDAVQAGETLEGLVEDYGLSTDEAELLLALHRDTSEPGKFRHAN